VLYTPKDSMALQNVKQELMNCYQNKHKSPTDYIARLIGVQNKFTALGEVLEDKEVVMQYAFGCQPEYMVAYQSLKRDADNKNEIVTMYMILTEMSSLYHNITRSQEAKQDQDVALLGSEQPKHKKWKKHDKRF
jgi:hypothetical protein